MRISKSDKTSVKASAEPNTPDVDKTKQVRQIIKQAEEIRDYFQSHNNNLNRKQEQYLEDLSDGIDSESISAIRTAIENMKYNSKNLRSEKYDLIMDLYDEFNLADGKFRGIGYPESDDVEACGDVKASTVNTDAIKHIKAAIDILGKSGNKDAVTKDSIANLATVMFDIKASTVTAASKCKYSMKECIDAIQDQYGKNKKEAEEYYKSADAKTLEALVDGFKGNAKKTFYDD